MLYERHTFFVSPIIAICGNLKKRLCSFVYNYPGYVTSLYLVMFIWIRCLEQKEPKEKYSSTVFLAVFKTSVQNRRYLPMPLLCEFVDEALSSAIEVILMVYEYHGEAEYTRTSPR